MPALPALGRHELAMMYTVKACRIVVLSSVSLFAVGLRRSPWLRSNYRTARTQMHLLYRLPCP